jgi:predicted HTH transcriptional regulator
MFHMILEWGAYSEGIDTLYCESFGTGIQRIAEACEEAGVKVEFRNGKLGFSVIFYRPVNHTNHTNATD